MFPVGRIHRLMKEGRYSDRIGFGGAIYLSAVLEYLTIEVMDLAGERAKELNKQRITPQHILYAMRADAELEQIARNVVFASGGVVPREDLIGSALAPSAFKKTTRDTKSSPAVVLSQQVVDVQAEHAAAEDDEAEDYVVADEEDDDE